MDAGRFDALARTFTAAGSRRRTLAAALSAALGLGAIARPEVAPAAKSGKCKPKCGECERCKRGDCERKNGKKRCQKGKCKPKPAGTSCAALNGGICQDGACTCPNGLTNCGGACVNLLTSRGNCGGCGAGCGFNEQCSNGVCRCGTLSNACATGTSCCLEPSSCRCGSVFIDPTTCGFFGECPAGSTPCTASSNNCFGANLGRACCPAGTRCDEGTCRYV